MAYKIFLDDLRPEYINIHSDHPTGSREMVKYAETKFEGSVVTRRINRL